LPLSLSESRRHAAYVDHVRLADVRGKLPALPGLAGWAGRRRRAM